MSNSVQNLRDKGLRVKVTHYRISRMKKPRAFVLVPAYLATNDNVYPKGGLTTVSIKFPSGKEIYGEARCSHKDPFNRKEGVSLAIERAFDSLYAASDVAEAVTLEVL